LILKTGNIPINNFTGYPIFVKTKHFYENEKIYPTPRKISGILVLALLFFAACKKMDSMATNEQQNVSSTTEKFFNQHRTSDPREQALINYLQRINKKTPFLEQTAKQIGFPRWDKILRYKKKNISTTSFGASAHSDSSEIFYIPFVRDTQNFVNASMIITANSTDTSFEYKCDWQYAQMENDPETANGAAEHYAAFFMAMDKLVFRFTKFNIIDSNLFRTAEHSKTLQVRINSNSSNNNFYDIIELCDEMVIWYEDCHYADTDACRSGIFIEGIGTVYKQAKHFRVKLNKQSGSITSISEI